MEGYVSPWMNEDLAIFRDQVRRFFEREMVPHVEKWRKQHRVDREAWLKAGEAGILCASIPEEYGGAGGTLAYEAVIAEEAARTGVGSGFGAGNGVHSAICAHYILAYGTEEQKQRWLPKMASGEMICAVAMTEPGTGSDLQAVRTIARREGDDYLISGQKTFITNGQNADLVIVVAKTDREAAAHGISLIVVEVNDAPGFRRGRNLEKIGMADQDTSELFFDDVRVPAQNVLGGAEGQGFMQLMQQLGWERVSCALGAVVCMEMAVKETVKYTKERKAFGKPIIHFQNTQFKLAECKTAAVAARIFIDNVMVRQLDGTLDPITSAMVKWWCTEQNSKVVDECLQLHGGYGYMMEYPIARMWTDTRVQKIFAGTNEIMKMIIGRTL
ncbi:acyl-CoA dehydrogenase [Oleomonas cavernae]|uniref:Acyl-CoA dehydrogenase n=2 Tax=Oleomonas cavernae TaxID=2320859 RepID=A0A418WUL4_9PROT|nr:acyl-CoA dehydrogenase [Oleomonas cavernae]